LKENHQEDFFFKDVALGRKPGKNDDFTVQSLSDKMNINRVSLSNHINGNPSVEVLERIATALNVPVADLFEHPEREYMKCPNCHTRLEVELRKKE